MENSEEKMNTERETDKKEQIKREGVRKLIREMFECPLLISFHDRVSDENRAEIREKQIWLG